MGILPNCKFGTPDNLFVKSYSYEVKEYGMLFSDFKAVERRINDISEILTDEIYYLDSEDEDWHDEI